MQFSLDDRTSALSVGEFADFTLGPRDAGPGGAPGLWRAQLGQRWHGKLRRRTEAECPSAQFEVPIEGRVIHRGWTVTLGGRIDQIVPTADGGSLLREIKTVLRPLPAPETELRAEHPEYFVQLAAYVALLRTAPPAASPEPRILNSEPTQPSTFDLPGAEGLAEAARPPTSPAPRTPHSSLPSSALRAELLFVEAGSGLTQAVALTLDDGALFRVQLERIAEFLDLRLRACERLRGLRYRPAFAVLRPGQETIQQELAAAMGGGVEGPVSKVESKKKPPSTVLLFEAPTGFGKTGAILEFALGQLRDGRYSRLVYLTGKSTGQLQVVRTLSVMTSGDPHSSLVTHHSSLAATPVAAWQVRPKSEHCVNQVFHCVRDACSYLHELEARWAQGGLARFYLSTDHPRDLETLRVAGREARVCPYEITRAALPFNDVWIGYYNYVFAPDSRGVFAERTGFNPAETLLVIDEAHNLPARVADAWSHAATADDAHAVLAGLHGVRAPAPLLLAWEHWARLLGSLERTDELDPSTETDVREALDTLARHMAVMPLDYAALGPRTSEHLWHVLSLHDWLAGDFTPSPEINLPLSGLRSPKFRPCSTVPAPAN